MLKGPLWVIVAFSKIFIGLLCLYSNHNFQFEVVPTAAKVCFIMKLMYMYIKKKFLFFYKGVYYTYKITHVHVCTLYIYLQMYSYLKNISLPIG